MKYLFFILLAICAPANATVAYLTTLQVTATTTSTKILNVNNARTYLIIQNIGSNNVIVNTATQGGTQGLIVPPGGAYEPINAPINEIWVKSVGGSSNITVIQGN